MLDALTTDGISWRPFISNPLNTVLIYGFYGFLRYLNIVEPYMPKVVLRQFVYRQAILSMSIQFIKDFRSSFVSYIARQLQVTHFGLFLSLMCQGSHPVQYWIITWHGTYLDRISGYIIQTRKDRSQAIHHISHTED